MHLRVRRGRQLAEHGLAGDDALALPDTRRNVRRQIQIDARAEHDDAVGLARSSTSPTACRQTIRRARKPAICTTRKRRLPLLEHHRVPLVLERRLVLPRRAELAAVCWRRVMRPAMGLRFTCTSSGDMKMLIFVAGA
jgi:hypothetical protein